MLVRRAVAVMRQRHPLAGRALARRRAALERVAVQVEALAGLAGEELIGAGQVELHDAVDALLAAHREVHADVVEQRARGTGEVVAGRSPGPRPPPPRTPA